MGHRDSVTAGGTFAKLVQVTEAEAHESTALRFEYLLSGILVGPAELRAVLGLGETYAPGAPRPFGRAAPTRLSTGR